MRDGRWLADRWGVTAGYQDAMGRWRATPHATRRAIRAAMGVRSPDTREETSVRLLKAGAGARLERPGELCLEDGTRLAVDRRLPRDLPPGVHGWHPAGGGRPGWLIVTPQACPPPPERPAWGWALQLYAVRSATSWGMGDFGDLRGLARWSRRELGADFALLNPLGAPLPLRPQENSPYSPSSRLFMNPLYVRVEDVPGAQEAGLPLERLARAGRALNADRVIDRDEVFRHKVPALERLWRRRPDDRRLDRYRAEQGELLRRFATFCALAEHHRCGWSAWPARFRRPDSAAVARFAADHEGRVRFHEWVQWLLDEQLARAAREMPLMLDVPIGVSPDGFDAWQWQDDLALGAAVGAPPDEYNTLGQNWSLPPFIPHRLRDSGYEPIRRTFRAMMRHARGLRVDHVMGLFRLYWIPPGAPAAGGGFVRYRAEEILAVLAIESHRAGAVIVGEDLGTVEPGVRAELRRRNVLSYRLLWFERGRPEGYPAHAMGAITTHDLFTVAGLWTGRDLSIQQRLRLNPNVAGMAGIRRRLGRLTGLEAGAPVEEVIVRAHRVLRRAPCKLLTATLEDALAVEERPNMPGTVSEWPNWKLALPAGLADIKRRPLVRDVARALGPGGRRPRRASAATPRGRGPGRRR